MPQTGALKDYTTKIEPHTTLGEIIGLLTMHGAKQVQTRYEDGMLVGVDFQLVIGDTAQSFRLPVNIDVCFAVLTHQYQQSRLRSGGRPDRAQAARVAWRIVKDWIAAQIAFIESGMVKPEEVFFPYLLTDGSHTLFDRFEQHHTRLLEPPQEEAHVS